MPIHPLKRVFHPLPPPPPPLLLRRVRVFHVTNNGLEMIHPSINIQKKSPVQKSNQPIHTQSHPKNKTNRGEKKEFEGDGDALIVIGEERLDGPRMRRKRAV